MIPRLCRASNRTTTFGIPRSMLIRSPSSLQSSRLCGSPPSSCSGTSTSRRGRGAGWQITQKSRFVPSLTSLRGTSCTTERFSARGISSKPRCLVGLYRLGALGFLPAAEYVNRGGTPVVGLLLSALVSLALVITGTFEFVLAITAFFFVANYTLAFVSLLVLRKKEPATVRPFKAKGHPWTTAGVFLLSLAFLAGAVAADTRNSVYSVILLGLSWPIYRFMRPKTATL